MRFFLLDSLDVIAALERPRYSAEITSENFHSFKSVVQQEALELASELAVFPMFPLDAIDDSVTLPMPVFRHYCGRYSDQTFPDAVGRPLRYTARDAKDYRNA